MKKTLHIYNSLTRKKEVFKPLNKNFVGIYCCGPTVYSDPHIGNFRSFITYDIIVRTLKYIGFKVRYVRNITDIGHLTENEEDKIEKKAFLEKIAPMEIAQRYGNMLREISKKFNLLPPNIEPLASGHIPEQIEMIKTLIEKKMAYEINGSVYFDVQAYNSHNNYGELSGRKVEELFEQTRNNLAGGNEKKYFADFSLWKKAEPNKIMKWKSPWSEGVPGWHLECSVMSEKYLGKTFDIHGGGMDLKFPHHECEIAQSKGANGKSPAKYWIHGNMLTVNGTKMSKSLNNHITANQLISGSHPMLTEEYDAMVIKFFFLQSNYKSTSDISDEALKKSKKGYKKLISSLGTLDKIIPSNSSSFSVKKLILKVEEHLLNDFDTPQLIAELFNGLKIINKLESKDEKISKPDLDILKRFYNCILLDVLGFKKPEKKNTLDNKKLIQLLVEIRNNARIYKNFDLSDKIRNQLKELNIELSDKKNNTE